MSARVIASTAAWFVDGGYLYKVWQNLHRTDKLDYLKLRRVLESTYLDTNAGEKIEDAYYFNADQDPPTAKTNAFHSALSFPPPNGPGLRVKLYWLTRKLLYWPNSMGGGPVVHPKTGQQFELTQQKAVDVGLAFHLMRSFGNRQWRKLFLAAGDGDFHEAVQHLVEHEDVDVILIGTLNTISDELRPYARDIFKLDERADDVARS
jgi:uncharacterized LabA/DUF88 family protein